MPWCSGIYRALVRHHLIEPKNSRKRLPTYKRWERGRPNELWQMDIVGGVLLDDGIECKVLTGVDNHSRFCVVPASWSGPVPDRSTGSSPRLSITTVCPKRILIWLSISS